MNHTTKLQVARRLMSKDERKSHEHTFNSTEWNDQKTAIRGRVIRTETRQRAASLVAKERKGE